MDIETIKAAVEKVRMSLDELDIAISGGEQQEMQEPLESESPEEMQQVAQTPPMPNPQAKKKMGGGFREALGF